MPTVTIVWFIVERHGQQLIAIDPRYAGAAPGSQ